jgi:hypothetical protein
LKGLSESKSVEYLINAQNCYYTGDDGDILVLMTMMIMMTVGLGAAKG